MADLTTFVFLLTVWTADSNPPDVYVEDHSLTGSDCAAAVAAYDKADPEWTRGVPSCEIDTGDWTPHPYDSLAICDTDACENPVILPACEYEDSDNCFWDARFRGNGDGRSFYVIDGVVTYDFTIDP